jgi:hypothetical protein
VHPVGGLLRFAGSEDGAGIVLQHFDPRGNIRCMIDTRTVGDAQIGEDKPAENLGDLS